VTGAADGAEAFPRFSQDYASDFSDLLAPVDPLIMTLEAGEYELRFSLRESDSRLDKFSLEQITN